jgi:nucleotide-binding universal stress UspA family protein
MFENVLIATDGSKHSERAARVGVDLAKTYGGKVIAVYVGQRTIAPVGGLSPQDIDQITSGMWNAIKDEGNTAIQYVSDLAQKSNVQVEKKFIEGHPASEILKIAEQIPVSVIVMGSIGKTGLSKFLLGSVAEKVVRNSKVPVLIVPSE